MLLHLLRETSDSILHMAYKKKKMTFMIFRNDFYLSSLQLLPQTDTEQPRFCENFTTILSLALFFFSLMGRTLGNKTHVAGFQSDNHDRNSECRDS